MPSGECLVIGIGNPDRGDDAVGLIVAKRIKARRPPGVGVVEHDGEPGRLLDYLGDAQSAYLIDACKAGAPPGTISRFDVAATKLPRLACGYSTHEMGLVEAVELARALGRLPRRCVTYVIEGRTYDIGGLLSAEVAAAAEKVAELIWDELCDYARPGMSCSASKADL